VRGRGERAVVLQAAAALLDALVMAVVKRLVVVLVWAHGVPGLKAAASAAGLWSISKKLMLRLTFDLSKVLHAEGARAARSSSARSQPPRAAVSR
jgi:hypothetical protein